MVDFLVLLLLAQQTPPAADQAKRTELNLLGGADAVACTPRSLWPSAVRLPSLVS